MTPCKYNVALDNVKSQPVNRLCTAKGIWLEENSGCSPVQVPIIKVKVSAPRRSSSQAARGRDPLLAAVSQRFTFSAPRPPRHTSSNQPTLLPAAGGTVLLLCSTSVAKLLLLRTFSAHSALGLETRPTEMECFLMTGSTRGRRVATLAEGAMRQLGVQPVHLVHPVHPVQHICRKCTGQHMKSPDSR